jgi:hypothetical protein
VRRVDGCGLVLARIRLLSWRFFEVREQKELRPTAAHAPLFAPHLHSSTEPLDNTYPRSSFVVQTSLRVFEIL